MHFNTHASSADVQLPAHQDSDLAALQTTSQHPDTDTLSMNMHPRVKISLSQPQDAVCHSEAPAACPDIRFLYGEAVDGVNSLGHRIHFRDARCSRILIPIASSLRRCRDLSCGNAQRRPTKSSCRSWRIVYARDVVPREAQCRKSSRTRSLQDRRRRMHSFA